MWKDWLAFSRKEQYGIILLTFLIFILVTIRLGLGFWNEPPELVEKAEFDDIFETKGTQAAEKSRKTIRYNFSIPFNPNKVDVTTLDQMGFSSFVVVNWIKYLEAGGHFNTLSDIGKVYGIDSIALQQMKPFIDFSSDAKSSPPGTKTSSFIKKDWQDQHHESEDSKSGKPVIYTENAFTVIDINAATSEELQKIHGIGEVFSDRIVAFRKLLGGFYTVEQISEVFGISKELFEDIRSNLKVNKGPFRKLRINNASLRELKAHPYINFYQARDIIECRKKRGEIENPEVLKELPSFDDGNLEKILPYFSFKEN